MCRVVQRHYPPMPASASEARRLTTTALTEWGLAELVDTAQLLVSELVTNVVLHAHTEITFTLAVAETAMEAGVADREPRPPRVRHATPPSPDEEGVAWLSSHGRGMFLVDQLADEWGVQEFTDGKQIWFRLAAGGSPLDADCACSRTDLPSVRLGSGRSVVAMSPDP